MAFHGSDANARQAFWFSKNRLTARCVARLGELVPTYQPTLLREAVKITKIQVGD
jgi:hypothetical protein